MARDLVPQSRPSGELAPAALPAIIASTGKRGTGRFVDFFTANIRNPNTRRAYFRAATDFFDWLQKRNVHELVHVQPIHVSGYIEELTAMPAAPSVKQHLAAIRMLLDWLVTGQVIPSNPAHSVRGPRHSAKKGKTPVLTPEEARTLLDSIKIAREVKLKDGTEKEEPLLVGLRDRALIGLMVYTFARVGAAVAMNVEDYYWQGRRWWVRLHEKGGKRHEMPAHHNLDEYLAAYLAAAGIGGEKKGPLFRTAIGKTGELTEKQLAQVDVYRMIKRRAKEAGIKTEIGCHTFRATGITAYLKNGGRLELAQQMAAHESARTTGLYDRRGDEISLDEVERISI